jgi:hypothetical protein
MIIQLLDYNGVFIGNLEIPNNSSDEFIIYQKSLYSQPPGIPIVYKLAQIISNKVIYILNTIEDITDLVILSNYNVCLKGQTCDYVIRIDNLNPMPEVGWSYDGTNFFPPV